MDGIRAPIEALKVELTKPEVSASLRMVNPEVYAQITAIIAVYEVHLIERLAINQTKVMTQKEYMEQQLHMYKIRAEHEEKYVKPTMLGRLKDKWIP